MIKEVIYWLEKHYVLSFIICLLIAIFIFYMSSKSFEKGTPIDFPFKSIVYHFSIFFVFAFFLSISMKRGNNKNKYLVIIAILISIAYGISDELHQFFVPGRSCTISDVLLDSIGIFSANIVYSIIPSSRNSKQHQAIF